MSKNLFITGTGTDVGKTYVTALILKKLQEAGISCGYYKAAMSGNEKDDNGNLIPGDALFVKDISGIEQPLSDMCPYIYEAAYSPHLASRLEGNPVNKEVVMEGFRKTCEKYAYVTMEGSGGILCPIDLSDKSLYLWELVKELNLSCLIVADAGLGTINNVGLTAAFMKKMNIPVAGIIMNHFHPGNVMEEDNKKVCEQLTGIPVVACVEDGDKDLDIDLTVLTNLYKG